MRPTDTTGTTPVRLAADRAVAIEHARVAYARLADVIEGLGDDEWDRSTDCEGWTVRHLVAHVVGAMAAAASIPEQLRQGLAAIRRSRARREPLVDALTAVQVAAAADLDDAALAARARRLVGAAAAGRRRVPAPLRRWLRVPVRMGTIDETWRLGYLTDVVLTRDAWLHRIDLCRAVGRDPLLTADHDGVIVADVAAEWADRHGRPHRLVLTGPAGSTSARGPERERTEIEIDAVEFCRILSGRTGGSGLLTTEVPF